MGECKQEFMEVQFVIEPETTECYVRLKAIGDCPINLDGWHHKSFHKDVSVLDILKDHVPDAALWENKAPLKLLGFTDKKGKEIREGDKVSLWWEEIFFQGTVTGQIVWSPGRAAFVIDFPQCGAFIALAEIDLDYSNLTVVK